MPKAAHLLMLPLLPQPPERSSRISFTQTESRQAIYVGGLPAFVLAALPLPQLIQRRVSMWLKAYIRVFTALLGVLLVIIGLGTISPQLFANKCNCHCKLGRETAAISTLRTIHNLQAQFQENHSHLASMKELAEAGLVSEKLTSNQPASGYIYSDFGISTNTYCVSATRVNFSCWFGLSTSISAYRDFVICEDGIIRGNESKTIRPLQRGEGQPISESPNPTP